jgi:hypothetical protein
MNLLTNEKMITVSNESKIILTTIRLHMSDKDWGYAYSNTIFLEDISSVEVKYDSHIIFLILAGLAAIVGIGTLTNSFGNNEQSILFFIVAAFLFLLYWFTRQHIISIIPNGGKAIKFVVNNMRSDQIIEFVDNVQAAKLQRLNEIYKL